MLGTIRNKKEFKNSFINTTKPIDLKQKINKLSNLKKIDNKPKQSLITSSYLTHQINFNRKNNDNNSKQKKITFNKDIIFFTGFQSPATLPKLNKNNSLTPDNRKNNLYKSDSMPQILRKNNNNNNNKGKTPKNSIYQKKILKDINNNKINYSFSNNSFNHSNMNNFTGFNSTKNFNVSNYNNSKFFKSSYDNNTSLTKDNNKKKYFSKFFYKSQSDLINSKRIYKHYIKEEEKEKIKPVYSFLKGGNTRSIKQLKESYKDDIKFKKRLKELKYNSTIAFKDDFNIFDYQSTLIKLLSRRVSQQSLHEMQKNFVAFNEKNYGILGPKGRFTNMAEKIKYSIPLFLYEKIRKLDSDKLISRYNYYKKINQNIRNNIQRKYELKKKKKNKNRDNSFGEINKESNNTIYFNSYNKSG